MMQQGATWDRCITSKFGASTNADCEHCGFPNADIVRVIWACPALSDTRDKLCRDICPNFDYTLLHPSILRGVAPSLSISAGCTFWGTEIRERPDDVRQAFGIQRDIRKKADSEQKLFCLSASAEALICDITSEFIVNRDEDTIMQDYITAAQIMPQLKRT